MTAGAFFTEMPLSLADKTIVVTRPREQAGELGAAIEKLGGRAYYFPLLEIHPVKDRAPLLKAAKDLHTYSLAVFVSPNAVAHTLPILLNEGAWPDAVRSVAVGPGTAKALADAGIHDCLYPRDRYDSEALLALPELAQEQVAGKNIIIFRGNGGRELLGETLEARGARVVRVTCYQRTGPETDQADLVARLKSGKIDGITVSSSEALGYLSALLDDPAPIWITPLFVSHGRIAERAEAMGFLKVVLVDAAAGGVLAGLSTYNWLR